ncbi:MAG: MATE family efflux transporter [Solidesulfovibrio sp. DCME]|uniref:MATE family efflux transporter n=1 Tax=Solidesulfovibrio sp. DCME TaxID=3447380 RepID=UPI003D0A91D5
MKRWHGPGGYAHVLRVGLPLLAGMASITAMHLTDRLFLGWYSSDALAAAMPAGAAFFLFTSFFLGTVGYVGVLIAQNIGAGRPEAIGAVLWQGIYFSLASFVALFALSLGSEAVFAAMDHAPAVRRLEVTYFRVLMSGAGFMVLESCLAAFFSGRGLTRAVMVVNFGGALLNIPLNYILIFGKCGLPALGTAGSALATVAAWAAMVTTYAVLVFSRRNDGLFSTRRAFRPDWGLFRKLVLLGMPGGAQIFLDIFAVTVFIALAGRLGVTELAATSIVLSANTPAFMPLLGLSSGLAVVVGQAMGAGQPGEARRAAGSALRIMAVYMAVMAVFFLGFPEQLASFFRPHGDDTGFAAILPLCRPLFAWGVGLGLCDIVLHTCFGVLRGAGDTRFLMVSAGLVSFFALVAPAWLAVTWLHVGIVPLWGLFVLYALTLAVVLALRYRGGAWQKLRLVEPAAKAGR